MSIEAKPEPLDNGDDLKRQTPPENSEVIPAKRARNADIDISRATGRFDLSVLKRYNMYFLTKYVLCDKVSEVNFCMQVGLMPCSRKCARCRRDLRLSVDRHDNRTIGLIFRCTNNKCRKDNCSVRHGTIFDGSRLYLGTILKLIALYIGNITSYEQLQYQCVDERGVELSSSTVSEWLSHFREIQLEAIVRHSGGKIGGPGSTVEIYECKIWRHRLQKYQDMVCGVCCESGGMFAAACGEPDSERMMEIIAANVAAGSVVITDCWEQYDLTEREKWVHLAGNYNLNFVHPSRGSHNHSVECTYWQVKRNLPITLSASSVNIVLHSAQYIWRRQFGQSGEDACLTFIRHIRESYPAKTGDTLLEASYPTAAV